MTPKQEAALRQAREALDDRTSLHKWQKAREAIDEALAEQPAQPCGYPYCGCNSKAWCKVEQQSGIKQVIELYDSPEQPAPVAKPHERQDHWQEEARRYAQNAEFWRGKYEAATAQQQEPVAYIRKDQLQKAAQSPMLCEVTPEPRQDRIGIYTSPPASKPWQGLTEGEIRAVIRAGNYDSMEDFARAIEAKLRELNEHKEKNA